MGRKLKRVSHWNDDSLIKLERISWILSPSESILTDDPELWVSKEDDPKNWHVQVTSSLSSVFCSRFFFQQRICLAVLGLCFSQVFRSIDSGSLKGFPKDVFEAESQVSYPNIEFLNIYNNVLELFGFRCLVNFFLLPFIAEPCVCEKSGYRQEYSNSVYTCYQICSTFYLYRESIFCRIILCLASLQRCRFWQNIDAY